MGPSEHLLPAAPGMCAPARRAADAEAQAEALVRNLGDSDYLQTWRAMQAFTDGRDETTPDEVWLTEHASVYTLGLAGRREHLLRDNGIPVIKADRGGQVTHHGPGQTIAYVLVDIRRRRMGVRSLVRCIEGAVVELLAGWGIVAHGRVDAPGVYVERNGAEAKIAALGLKIRNGRSYHGIALNRHMDLAPFEDIDPCGFRGLAVTQMHELGAMGSREAVEAALAVALVRALHGATPKGVA